MGGKGGLTEYTRTSFDTKATPAQNTKLINDVKALINAASRRLSVIVLVEPDAAAAKKKKKTKKKKRKL